MLRSGCRAGSSWGRALVPVSLLVGIGCVCAVVPRVMPVRFDDNQLVAFPFFVATLYLLGKRSPVRIPPVLLLIATGAYLITSLFSRGVLQLSRHDTGVTISRLAGDYSSARQQMIYRAYSTVAPIGNYPPIFSVNRSFSSNAEILEWSDEHKISPVVVSGSSQWLSIVSLPPRSLNAFLQTPTGKRIAKIDGDHLELDYDGTVRRLVVKPSSVSLSFEPTDLAIHYIAKWTSGTLSGDSLSNFEITSRDALTSLVSSEAEFSDAATLEGHWRTPVARSAAQFMVGNSMLLQAFVGEEVELRMLRCAERQYQLALKRLRASDDPSLTAALYNNLAVSRSFHVRSKRDRRVLRRYLETALKLEMKNKLRPRAKQTFNNLVALRLL